VLHLATHGFFLAGAQPAAAPGRSLELSGDAAHVASAPTDTEDPLLRSGLALAGTNLHHGGDAILTSLEVAGLDLWGTKLVVLSACDTGVGEVQNGEGVYGLRRALVLSGSETQVMSLWAVSDTGTRDLMIGYYKRLAAGEGRSAAMREVRLAMLKDHTRRHPFYWASFIVSGEWANLDGRR
jgi:CHAT domain-containing protein